MSGTDNDFSSLFELLPIGAYRTDARSRQVRANRAMVRIFGFETEEEMLSTQKSRAEGWYVDPTRRALFREALERDGAVRDFVSEMRRHGTGETFWISENAHLVRDGSGCVLYHEGTVEDITERKRAEDMLQVTLDNAGRGIARVDAEGRMVLYNRRLLELLDLPEEMLAARPFIQDVIRYQEERGDFGPDMSLVIEGSREAFEIDLASSTTVRDLASNRRYLRRTRDGRVIEVTSQPLIDGGMVRTFSDVTAYIDAQRELAEKSRELQITLDSMTQGIAAMDAQDRVMMTNRRFQELLGFTEEFLTTRPTLEQLLKVQIERGDFGEDFDAVESAARRFVAQNVKPADGPVSYMRRTREGRTLEVLTRPLPDGGVVRTYTDMTDYVAAQEALARKEALLRALVQNIPDRVWVKDAEGKFQLLNPAFARRFGLREEEVIGRTSDEVFGPQFAAVHLQADLQALATGQPQAYEQRVLDVPSGTYRYAEVVKAAMRDESGACVGMLGIARDITERKHEQAALIAAKEAAEAAERAKAQFLANMSHEIRTPMNAVIGMSDLLLRTDLDARQREFAETIRTSGDTLLALINDILDFSKIESGSMSLERVPVPLADCVESALDLASAAAAAKGVELMYWIEDGVPPAVVGDPVRLRQVFVNLVSNAVKFTREGEVAVTLSRRRESDGRETLHASVRDTGIGIPADRLHRLFQMFSQVDSSTTREFGGTGLGLAISRRLVELMGGRIWVESEVGVGSDFKFELPLEPAEAKASTPPHGLRGRRVLLIDDNLAHARALGLHCERLGVVAVVSHAVAPALAALESVVPDVIMADARISAGEAAVLAVRRPLVLLAPRGASPAQLPPNATLLGKPVKAQGLARALAAACGLGEPASMRMADPSVQLARQFPLRILLAEDNAVNQRVAALVLEGLGYGLEIAANGQLAIEAVAAACRQGEPFDVVLMDMQMPVLDGIATTRRLCEHYPSPAERPWLVAMTANAMPDDREKCLEAGMDDYLSKPIRSAAVGEALVRAAQAVTARRAQEPAPEQPRGFALLAQLDTHARRGVAELFASEAPRLHGELLRALERNDAQGVAIAAHTLAGSSCYFDAAALERVCRSIEAAANAGELESVARRRGELEQAIGQAVTHAAEVGGLG